MVSYHGIVVDQRPCLFILDMQAPQSHRRKRKKGGRISTELRSKVANSVDRFRHFIRTTESLILGDFATAFFTGAEVLDTAEIFFDDVCTL
jgi:hypothetical protein